VFEEVMRVRRRLTSGVLLVVCAGLLGGSANAAYVRVGTLVLRADGGFAPRDLPRKRYAPIRFQGHGEIETTDGSVPPALQHVRLDFDRDGRLTTAGLPVCPPSRVEATTSRQARRRCRGAIVGAGHIGAVVDLAGGRLKIRSPLTLFNGPRRGRNWTVVAHAQARVPVFESYVVVVPVERRRGTYGYRSSFDVPRIAGGLGSLTHIDVKVGRRYRFHGARRSYVSARCSDGILQTQGYFGFADGTIVYGSVFKGCTGR
jgi:hypothetical protein